MLSKILPIAFLITGTAGGLAVGLFVLPSPKETGLSVSRGIDEKTLSEERNGKDSLPSKKSGKSNTDREYVKLERPFVIPLIDENEVTAFVTVSLGLETKPGDSDKVYGREPKLRDSFLRVLFDHANSGGFRGVFTQSIALDPLKHALTEVARNELDSETAQVLIVDINRQES
ncbi:flagellar basal body-associated FliL family protein [Primorskyibacter sp. S87]|uniref:flagellar basal body-associated FliL family protein n=1 Tax=Primorskyibacter sp. S87 TaxID=3415126 RepID=UPI003C7D627D